jgi:dihydroneopterin aldolase
MSVIAIEGMDFYSYHGHFEEESIIGTRFKVDLYLHTDTSKAQTSDHLHDTVNYLEVYQCVKKQMETPSYLIEHVARRIVDAVMLRFENVEKVNLKLRKMNPPLGGQIESVSIELSQTR